VERVSRAFQQSDLPDLQVLMDIQEKRDCQVCLVKMEIRDCKALMDYLEKRETLEFQVFLVI
jgi:uncharacterized protein (UPF0264 family)